jgi:hypothetical protein
VDGSKIHLPRSFLKLGYPLPSNSANYPQGLLSCLYQLKSKIPFDFALTKHHDERLASERHLQTLKKNDVVVFDRGYFSYVMLHRHREAGIHAIFRLQESSFTVIQNFFASNETDTIVSILPSVDTQRDIQKKHPNLTISSIPLRLIKYKVENSVFVLGTTLLDAKYTLDDFKDVYHQRWGVEELYKVSKRVIDVEDFHSKSERGVRQELFAHFVLLTMTRIFANHSDDLLNPDANAHALAPKSASLSEKLQTNFKACVHAFTRNMESLLLFHQHLKTAVRDAFRMMAGRYQRVRAHRNFPRRSMKPISKWQPSGKKKEISKGEIVLVPVPL